MRWANGKHMAEWPQAIVHIRMLKDQLNRHGQAQEHGNGKWHAQENERQDGDHKIELLMQGVTHQAIEAVKSVHTVMHAMQFPQPAHLA